MKIQQCTSYLPWSLFSFFTLLVHVNKLQRLLYTFKKNNNNLQHHISNPKDDPKIIILENGKPAVAEKDKLDEVKLESKSAVNGGKVTFEVRKITLCNILLFFDTYT